MPTKRKIIIFDFNRTLYDPENDKLFFGTEQLLQKLQSNGFELYLVSQNRDGRRNEIIEKSNILHFFKKAYIVTEKTLSCFEAIIKENVDHKKSFVVGDYIRQEIIFGNMIGLKTIWIKDDSLSTNYPILLEEHPTFIISSIHEMLDIINLNTD